MKKQVLILGGGFGGIYTALNLQKRLKSQGEFEITLINDENFFLFTPLLHEVASSDIDAVHIVNPIHKLLPKVNFFCGQVDAINLQEKIVTVSHGFLNHSHSLEYDHLVLALGSETHFYNLPGLSENAITMKSLGDALHLRNLIIGIFEEANFECSNEMREKLLTFVVAGAGFAGVETISAINDFANEIVSFYPNLKRENVKMILASSGDVVLPELHENLGKYAGSIMIKNGIQVKFHTKVTSYTDHRVTFTDGSAVDACTLIWTAGNKLHPILEGLPCEKTRGRLTVDETLELKGWPNVWAIGDCASIPDTQGGFHPTTAQHAIREAKVLASNIMAAIAGTQLKPFRFHALGQLASIGHRKGVAQIFGFRFSGSIAWILWRTIYLFKLPQLEKKIRVGIDWFLEMIFSEDTVQIPTKRNTH